MVFQFAHLPAPEHFRHASRAVWPRGLPLEKVQQLVTQETESPLFRLLGEPRVHVLRLNLALDALKRVNAPG